jgi:NAD-dependent SIR2 family protein deacetylase
MTDNIVEIYCVKCKKKTDTLDLTQTRTKNNRNMLEGKCVKCGTIKNKFIRSAVKGGNLLSLINKLSIELHLPGHNFTGPITNLKKRLKQIVKKHRS